jgi:P27 family predicted phage terminase small subunit
VKSKAAPKHLRAQTRQWWSQVVSDYELQPHHERLLTLAAEAWDRVQQARELVEVEGITPQNGKTRKLHPALALERDSMILFARMLRELNLDIDTPAQPYSRMPDLVRKGQSLAQIT